MATTKRRKYRKGLKADYRGATPEQVARVLRGYRPARHKRTTSEASVSDGAAPVG